MPKTLRGWIVAIAVLAIALGLLATRIVRHVVPAETRAAWLSAAGRPAAAEAVYWEEIQKGNVSVPLVVAFVEAHQLATAAAVFAENATVPADVRKARPTPERPLPDDVVDEFLKRSDLPREVSLIGRYVRIGDVPEAIVLHEELVEEAAKEPPMPWANHVLAREALFSNDVAEAVERFEREALAFGRDEDLAHAFGILEREGDWEAIREKLADPRIGPRAPVAMHFHLAVHDRAWGRAARWLLPYAFPRPGRGPLALAAIAAIAWFAFCLRLGQVRKRPAFRLPLHLAAFALGVLSLAPTDFLIVWQETVLHLVQTGEPVHDAIFFVLGVGFREELSKLLLFLPLLPFIRRWGSPLDVVTCGALVGLGFAAGENLSYFSRGDLTAALARFLTANFLHMSMTAITATAVDKIGRKEDGFYEFTVSFLTVVVLHGVYDFFLASSLAGDLSFLSMATFVVLAQRFVLAMHDARLRTGQSKPLLPIFAIGTAVVTGASFVYACGVVGPARAFEAMYLGLLGVAIFVIVFVKQLRHL